MGDTVASNVSSSGSKEDRGYSLCKYPVNEAYCTGSGYCWKGCNRPFEGDKIVNTWCYVGPEKRRGGCGYSRCSKNSDCNYKDFCCGTCDTSGVCSG